MKGKGDEEGDDLIERRSVLLYVVAWVLILRFGRELEIIRPWNVMHCISYDTSPERLQVIYIWGTCEVDATDSFPVTRAAS